MSTKTVAQKLLIKPGSTFWMSDPDKLPLLQPMPDGVVHAGSPATATVAMFLAAGAEQLRVMLDEHRTELLEPGVVWIAYPKANKADINRDSLWPIAAEYGLRPNGQVAVDDVWSALRFRALKDGEEPFTGGKPVAG